MSAKPDHPAGGTSAPTPGVSMTWEMFLTWCEDKATAARQLIDQYHTLADAHSSGGLPPHEREKIAQQMRSLKQEIDVVQTDLRAGMRKLPHKWEHRLQSADGGKVHREIEAALTWAP